MKSLTTLFFTLLCSLLLSQEFSVDEIFAKNYDGGIKEFRTQIAKNLRYPIFDADKGICGFSLTKIIVDNKNKRINVETLLSVSESIDNEAVRVISNALSGLKPLENSDDIFVFFMPIVFTINKQVAYSYNNKSGIYEEYKLPFVIGYVKLDATLYPSSKVELPIHKKLVKNVEKQFDKKNWAETIAYVDNVLRYDPLNFALRNKKIECLRSLGKEVEAQKETDLNNYLRKIFEAE